MDAGDCITESNITRGIEIQYEKAGSGQFLVSSGTRTRNSLLIKALGGLKGMGI